MSEDERTVAELASAAIGGHSWTAPAPMPVDTSSRSIVLPLIGIFLIVGIGVGGIAYHFHQTRTFHSDDPAVAFSSTTHDEDKRLEPIEQLVTQTGSDISIRAAHVTYTPVDGGTSLDGFAVEMSSRSLTTALPSILPSDAVVTRDAVLGGRELVTERLAGNYLQLVQTRGHLFLAVGASTTETHAVLRVLLHDEGLLSESSGPDQAVARHHRGELVL